MGEGLQDYRVQVETDEGNEKLTKGVQDANEHLAEDGCLRDVEPITFAFHGPLDNTVDKWPELFLVELHNKGLNTLDNQAFNLTADR